MTTRLGEEIKRLREKKGLSVSQLARLANMSFQYLRILENWSTVPVDAKRVVFKLEMALGVPTNHLLDLIDL
jgi:transcriptional regulator with XRE-family HTH domain